MRSFPFKEFSNQWCKRLLLAVSVLAAVAFTSCGKSEEKNAEVKPVEGLKSPGFSLAQSPQQRCDALVDYTLRFSEQHAPGAFPEASCLPQPNPNSVKINVKVHDPKAKQDKGWLVVYLNEVNQAEILLCRSDDTSGAMESSTTNCAVVGVSGRKVSLPEDLQGEEISLDDFVVSFKSYISN